jgi:molecular chaperone GrpE
MNVDREVPTGSSASAAMDAAEASARADERQAAEASDKKSAGGGSDSEAAKESATLEEAVTEAFEQELAAARRKADENWDRFLRAEADLVNQRKASERARKEALARQRRELLGRFLEIADNLDRAAQFDDAEREVLLEGLAGIRREIARIFEREGVARIESAEGAFDPNLHEAIGVVRLPGIETDQVVQVERAGYTMDGELLRPARVIIGQPAEDQGAGSVEA